MCFHMGWVVVVVVVVLILAMVVVVDDFGSGFVYFGCGGGG